MAVYNNGLPNENLRWFDIYETLYDNGGYVVWKSPSSAYQAEAKVNKWSKWKPQDLRGLIVDDEARFKANNWGISIPFVTSIEEAFKGCSEDEWHYLLPKGTEDSPYRIGDFRGYRADATSPFRTLSIDKNVAVAGDSVKVTLYCRMFNSTNEDGMLGLSDMGDLDGCRAAFIMKKPNGDYEVVMSDYIANNHGSATAEFSAIPNGSSYIGNYTVMAALTKGDGTYYPLPIKPKTFEVETNKIYTSFNIGEVIIEPSIISGTAYFTWGTEEEEESFTSNCIFELTDDNYFLQMSIPSTGIQTINRGEEKAFVLSWARIDLPDYVITLAEQDRLMCRASINNGQYVTGYTNVSLF